MPRKYSHSKLTQLSKYFFVIFAFLYLASHLLLLIFSIDTNTALNGILIITRAIFTMMCCLITAYFFQDIWVDEEGLLVEFLWRKIRVKWNDIEKMKKSPLAGIMVVSVKTLTPFHRIFGILYGFSNKPAFIISPSINDYEDLRKDIENHIKKKSIKSIN